MAPSVLQSRHFRVPAFDRRHTVPWLTRVTAHSRVMFGLASLVIQHCSHVIAAVCTMVKDDSVTHFVVLPKFSGERGFVQRTP